MNKICYPLGNESQTSNEAEYYFSLNKLLMHCKYCGKEIDDNSIYCKYCGEIQNESSIKRFRWKSLKINKTAIADTIIVIARELGIWTLIIVVLYLIVLGLVYRLEIGEDKALAIFITPIVLIILWRYVIRAIRWCIKWVNTYKSKK